MFPWLKESQQNRIKEITLSTKFERIHWNIQCIICDDKVTCVVPATYVQNFLKDILPPVEYLPTESKNKIPSELSSSEGISYATEVGEIRRVLSKRVSSKIHYVKVISYIYSILWKIPPSKSWRVIASYGRKTWMRGPRKKIPAWDCGKQGSKEGDCC